MNISIFPLINLNALSMTNQNDHKTRVLFKQTLILTRQYLLTTPYFESHISIPSFTMVSARRWFLLLVIQTLKCSLFIKKSFLQSFHDVLLSVIKFSTKTFYNALARGPFEMIVRYLLLSVASW